MFTIFTVIHINSVCVIRLIAVLRQELAERKKEIVKARQREEEVSSVIDEIASMESMAIKSVPETLEKNKNKLDVNVDGKAVNNNSSSSSSSSSSSIEGDSDSRSSNSIVDKEERLGEEEEEEKKEKAEQEKAAKKKKKKMPKAIDIPSHGEEETKKL